VWSRQVQNKSFFARIFTFHNPYWNCSINIEWQFNERTNISGLRHGFYTVITNPPTQPFECKNVLSATKYADDVSLLVNKELEKGYLIGPFIKLPFDIYRAIPIGIVEGKYPGKKRLILDLSSLAQS
jgi:hypothetical protein